MNVYNEIRQQHELDQFLIDVDYFSHSKVIEMAYFCPSASFENGSLDVSDNADVRILFFLQGAKFNAVELYLEKVKAFHIKDYFDLELTGTIENDRPVLVSREKDKFYCTANSLRYRTELGNNFSQEKPQFAFADPYLQESVNTINEICENVQGLKDANDIVELARQGELKMAFELLFSAIIENNLMVKDRKILTQCKVLGKKLKLHEDAPLSMDFWHRFSTWLEKTSQY